MGKHPADDAPVVVKDGRYGPYVTDGSTNATLPKGTEPASVTLEEAVRLIDERAAKGPQKRSSPKRGGGRRRTKSGG